MRITMTSLIRLAVVTALTASCAAVGISRLAPPERPWRMPCPVEYAAFNEFFLNDGTQGLRWVSRNGEGTIRLPFLADENLDYAACSPWRDDQGRSQVAGRWSRGIRAGAGELGIARLSFPDGEVLDHIVTNAIPLGAPCWYPGTTARILFASGDGQLYDYAFESPGTTQVDASAPSIYGADAAPRLIANHCPALADRDLFVSDPHWPTDSRFSRTIFVSLRSIETGVPHPVFNTCEIWWLRLSDNGRAIEDGGRLLDVPDDTAEGEAEERCPTLGRTPEGKLSLAYLRKTDSQPWELRAVAITFDGKTRRPVASPGRGVKLMVDCQPCQPTFTTDGRHILVVGSGSGTRGELRRVEVDLSGGRAAGSEMH
jgi:hypothetical protein